MEIFELFGHVKSPRTSCRFFALPIQREASTPGEVQCHSETPAAKLASLENMIIDAIVIVIQNTGHSSLGESDGQLRMSEYQFHDFCNNDILVIFYSPSFLCDE